ncbi:transposase [Trichonephila clavipes]|nr:transposase [Trichonephila clavipes]
MTILHTSVVTRQQLWELGWKVLMHPPYSPDPGPNDYRHFLTLQNFQNYKKLGSRDDCENRLEELLANKGQDCYERNSIKLPLKWLQIIQLNGKPVTTFHSVLKRRCTRVVDLNSFNKSMNCTFCCGVHIFTNKINVTSLSSAIAKKCVHVQPIGLDPENLGELSNPWIISLLPSDG